GALPFGGRIPVAVLGMAAQPVAEPQVPQVLVAIGAEDVQVDAMILGPEAAVLVPVGLTRPQGVADHCERRHAGVLVRRVGHDRSMSRRFFAGRPGTAVEPTWSTASARSPRTRRIRPSSRAYAAVHVGSYSSIVMGAA